MTGWLVDTLVWTAALIALVLVLRRPVARWFGPQFAYALWVLPMARLLLPPITLPSWMAPTADSPPLPPQAFETPVATIDGSGAFMPAMEAGAPAAMAATPSSGLEVSYLEAWPLVEIGCAVWLAGAAIFLWRRFGQYFELRDQLLSRGREVGRAGRVRLVETDGTAAPLAFGVIDPVVALPSGFMAQADRQARDFALAHELAHHRGHDLLINVAVQPLFALHWFNPLGRYGWLALRRDQEAACDARVVAAREPEERAAYGSLIASFAAGPNVALAAPMACPVLGDKSIIHRLRSLNMTETTPRRRWTGRLLIGAAVLALPLTASITYAEAIVADAPTPPAPLAVASAPPAPPAPPEFGEMPPVPPAPPAPPESLALSMAIQNADHKAENLDVSIDDDGKKRSVTIVKDGKYYTGEKAAEMLAEMKASDPEAFKWIDKPGLSEAEREARRAAFAADIEAGMAEGRARMAETQVRYARMGEEMGKSMARAFAATDCSNSNQPEACSTAVARQALKGARSAIREARRAIANDPNIPAEDRAEALRDLDEAMAELNRELG